MISLRRVVPKNRWLRLALVAGLVATAAVLVGRHVWAYREYRAARREAARYRLDKADAHARECLTVWSNRADVWVLAGQIARRRESYERAEQCFVTAQRLTGGANEDVQLERVLMQAQLDPDAKLDYLRSLVESGHPRSALIFEAMARGYLRKNRYADAGFVLHKWLEQSPDDLYALFCRGWVRDQLGPRVQAVEDYQRVLEIDPDHDEARLRLARLLLELARPDEALAAARPLATRHAGEPKVLVLLAECQYAVGDLTAAEATARVAVVADPNHDDALVILGRTLADAERYEEAERTLRAAIKVRPSHYQAHLHLHRLLVTTGRDAEARQVKATLDAMVRDISRLRDIFAHEFAKSPRNPALYREVGLIFLRSGETAKGIDWLNDALRLDPADPASHRELAVVYARIGDKNRADYHSRRSGPTGPAEPPRP